MNYRQENLLGDDSIKSAEKRGLEGNMTVIVHANVQNAPSVVGLVRLRSAGATDIRRLQRTLLNHRLLNDSCDNLVVISIVIIVVIRIVIIHEEMMSEAYPLVHRSTPVIMCML